MATGTRVDPYRGFNFLVEIDGITLGGFQEVSGLDLNTDVVDYRDGTDPNHTRTLIVTLKRGTTNSDELWKWRQTVINGKPQRKNGSIVLRDETGAEKIRWNFSEAWPSKWTGPALNAGTSAITVETLEITHEELKRA